MATEEKGKKRIERIRVTPEESELADGSEQDDGTEPTDESESADASELVDDESELTEADLEGVAGGMSSAVGTVGGVGAVGTRGMPVPSTLGVRGMPVSRPLLPTKKR